VKALIGRKVGMTQLFAEDGSLVPATVIEVDPNVVVGVRTADRDGYTAVVLGADELRAKRVTKPYGGQFASGMAPLRHLVEVRDFDGEPSVGDTIGVELFSGDTSVDVQGTSKGKGFQGVMKRHGFHGGRKSHGSKFHRAPGSIGQSASPSRVVKGKKMAGRMGGRSATVHNLRLVGIDAERRLLLVGGPCPGPRGGTLLVTNPKKGGASGAPVQLAGGVAGGSAGGDAS
jgi:large subunit ribosomal protein L3